MDKWSAWADTLPTLPRKLSAWIPAAVDGWELTPELDAELCRLLKLARMRVATSVIKTWANAWTTSSRMDEDLVLPCILGCQDCDDKLSHYISCDPLWTAVISASKGNAEQLQESPRCRLCLQEPSLDRVRRLAIAFSTYHALKLANRETIDSCVASGDFTDVQIKLLSLADAFAKELLS